MMKTHNCGELRLEQSGQRVTLAGWVNRRRDQGGLIFIDLRDRWGITQVVVDKENAPSAHEIANQTRNEFVIQVSGVVRQRPEGTENTDLPTGQIDVYADEITILSNAKTPPFYINREETVDEALRMRYRYLDLRRPRMQRNLVLRHRAIKFIRDWLDQKGFVEIETPILFKTTPEGARDFLVPSRLNPGKFYALPQSPQQLKQLLMVAGYERYFQIARCFRDEDLRGQRQPEFTQLDMELSFVERDDVMALNEELMLALIKAVAPEKELLFEPLPRIRYQDAMEQYGTDRPDLRYDLRAIDVSEIAGQSGFRVFVENVEAGKPVKVIRAPGYAAELSGTQLRKITAELEALAREAGAKGLAYMALSPEEDGEVKGPIGKFFSVEQKLELFEKIGAEPGDLLLFISDEREVVYAVIDAIRPNLAERLGLLDPNKLALCWVIDFPMFYWDEENQRWDPSQHMFTMPLPEDIPLLDTDPGAARGSQYDMVCNGHEVAGGSIRIHDRALQEKIFPLIGQTMEHAKEQFGHILEAFEYGVPPHGGIAWGLDRVVALLAGEPNIREVIAFPKTQRGTDAMAQAPSAPEPQQLEELFIQVVLPEEEQV
ncbi:MAG: aspartate--tRNA ligase [Chloroflexi bacterium]|nr:MAG: aspartate--tRNA ligase [Chloroflexota bacterium]